MTQVNAYETGRADFQLSAKGLVIPYSVFALSGLPGETLELTIRDTTSGAKFQYRFGESIQTVTAGKPFGVKLPALPGTYPLRLERAADGHTMKLNLFVMQPASRAVKGRLNGYRIGDYPQATGKKAALYPKPRGFIELTEDNGSTQLSPHFTLAQFPSKQASGYPKYLIVRERLVLKLELLLEELNLSGKPVKGFVIMSGYRTPFYNAAIGNVPFSRHVWGGAADIYIDDSPKDGMMDDLNGDGKINVGDSRWLYDFVEKLYGQTFYEPFRGGLGLYRSNSAHGPFVHIDVRGHRARWGH